MKLTQLVGEVDIQLNTALEENEALKQKLGMTSEESVDLSELRHKKNAQLEELKNMNSDLSQEVQFHYCSVYSNGVYVCMYICAY